MSDLLAVHGVGVVTDGYGDVGELAARMGDAPTATPHTKHAFDTEVVARALGGAGDCDATKVPSLRQKHGTRPFPEYGILDPSAVAQHDALAQLGLRAGHQAWTMAGLGGGGGVAGERIGLLVCFVVGDGGFYGGLFGEYVGGGGRYASPRHFSRSVYSSVASRLAIHFHIQGPCETLAFATDPVRGALWQARRLLMRGRAERVMVVWAEQASEIAHDLALRAAGAVGAGGVSAVWGGDWGLGQWRWWWGGRRRGEFVWWIRRSRARWR